MAGGIGDDGITRIGVAGALCREYAADAKAFLGFLADALQRSFPGSVEILYKGGFLSKKTVRGVCLTSWDAKYTLEDPGNGLLKATATHVVRGIALKTETIKVEDWLSIIAEITETQAAEHESARRALQDMLGLS